MTMAKDIGPEMLDRLEAKRPTMSENEYQARRLEIEELIRKGRAVQKSPMDQVLQLVTILLGMVLGFGWMIAGGNPVATFWGLMFIVLAFVIASRIGRRAK